MAEYRQCEFILLRYVPDVISGEALNFGVVLVEEGWPERGGAHVRLASEREWERLERLAPQADMEVLRGLGSELATDIVLGTATREGVVVRGELLRRYEDMFSSNVQLSERRAVLAESPVAEVEELAKAYLEHTVVGREAARTGRNVILERMKAEFQRWNVWTAPGFMKSVAVAKYAQTRNPMKLDFGYATRDGAQFKMYHAVSLEANANTATRLVATFPKLRDGLQRMQREARLTAIIGENTNPTMDEVSFAIEAMEDAGIRVETLAAMPRIAEIAAEELGV